MKIYDEISKILKDKKISFYIKKRRSKEKGRKKEEEKEE